MIRVALNHKTIYTYDQPVELGPQTVRLRPAPHCRTSIHSYSLRVAPTNHFLNWQQDPHANYLARLTFPEPTTRLEIEVDLIAEMAVINPFDFFLESYASEYPFTYSPTLAQDLKPYLEPTAPGPKFSALLANIDLKKSKTIDFLVQLNALLERDIRYVIRMEPGVQSPEETLRLGTGSCRDSAWLLVQVLRNLGLAARFASGYLIQLKPDVVALDGPSGTDKDFTDLHAWAEVFLPGAGWIGLDPTSGLLAGEGHIPLACTPDPVTAAPVTGTTSACDVAFRHEMSVTRVHEDPRVTKPYTEETWQRIEKLGHAVDARLEVGDVRLTMGGEPTFVSTDNMESDEWKTAAVGPTKRQLAGHLVDRLRSRFATGGLIHYGQGKWYPGESLPRWALTCMWRTDGEPVWKNPHLLADPDRRCEKNSIADAQQFTSELAEQLQVNPDDITYAYEDALYYVWKEQRLAINTDVHDAHLDDAEERARLARVYGRGLGEPVGCMLPLRHQWWNAQPRWQSGSWPIRSEHMFLIPGDSPMGLRLPMESLPSGGYQASFPSVPFESAEPLPDYEQFRQASVDYRELAAIASMQQEQTLPGSRAVDLNRELPSRDHHNASDSEVLRTAMCVEPRDGNLHVFMPPVEHLESYLDLLAAVERTAESLNQPVIIEGYLPPPDHRLRQIKVTPDPGVIEVNVHPAANWEELVHLSKSLYEDARQSRLGTEKFDVDGTHTGTGGGNHIVLGSHTPASSPFLRRPDLLRSFISYWHNHPSLSYLFSGKFVGPTSQAPRVDEGRRDAIYELQIAFEQIPDNRDCPPWLVDRIFRHLLVDLTGNTHRAEFCIDKLYSPDSATGRLGLVELRGFEMPPHWQMSLTQQLLVRSLVARFWEQPYKAKLVDWNTSIHDRWFLPHFINQDFSAVIQETQAADISLATDWFEPHFEFRFPLIGTVSYQGMQLELRAAIEPWYVLGEEPTGGGTARYVDSSVERIQVKVTGLTDPRHVITCNGRRLPLCPTGTEGEYVAGVRYRAWQPPHCLHPTIPSDAPLIFDILDTWMGRSIGGCRYHVGHPGGLNPESFPINAQEAESRRAARFFEIGHTGGPMQIPQKEQNAAFPLTLDLRRNQMAT